MPLQVSLLVQKQQEKVETAFRGALLLTKKDDKGKDNEE